ncbi:MAG: site-specific integrase [Polaromonas sp.]|nr:site-specific integrase [Polaromonas sp.]
MASIRERTDAAGKTKWHAQIRIQGHPPQTRTFSRKTDAKLWVDETERAIRNGRFSSINNAQTKTVAQLFEVFRADYMRKSRTKDYTQILAWWEQRLGKYFLIDVKAPLIQKCIIDLANTPFGQKTKKLRTASTITRYLAVLSRAFTVAVENLEWLDRSPIAGVKKPDKQHELIPRVLSPDEEERLLASAAVSENKFLLGIVLIAVRTGMRFSEIMRLRWNDFEWEKSHALIIVRRAKNNRQRIVPLPHDAFQYCLDRRQNGRAEEEETQLLFPNDPVDAKDVRPIDIRTAWRTCLRRAKIQGFRFHHLRHTCASRLAALGYSLPKIGELLGHQDHRSTQIYTHFSKDHAVKMVIDGANVRTSQTQ